MIISHRLLSLLLTPKLFIAPFVVLFFDKRL